ncbi:hypothetical protein [Niallia nealsonii]|uniref:Uncharacterized protein n=1 Tax=Niallia nealsonii TaxID=115979 RepID=A0A2N0YXD7_9BACI|nr:hypothetical protein [Niallia nealsonii]PKG21909.1 hypothetical protein CWS01_19995 [Niallia nealsonii]
MRIFNGKLLCFISSITLNALGNSFMITANLGSAPWTAAGQNLASILPISLGVCIIFMNFCSFILSYMMKTKFTLATIIKSMALAFIFGLLLDFFEYIHHMVYIPENIWIRCLYLIIGINLIAVAITIYFQLGSLFLPFDYLLKAFERLTQNYTVGTIFCMSIPLVLSILIFIFQHQLSGLGLGTILFVFGMGFLIDHYNRWIVLHTITEAGK